MTVRDIATLLGGYRFDASTEFDLQNGVTTALFRSGIDFIPEYNLGRPHGRVDIYLPTDRIGIELKATGSPTEVLRQLSMYAECPGIHGLILVSLRARATSLVPATLSGKPVATVCPWPNAVC